MGVPFLVRTSERVEVPVPQDDALTPEQRAALEAYDSTPRPWPAEAARFVLRGLSASELAQLRGLMPAMPAELAAAVVATRDGAPADERTHRHLVAYLGAVAYVTLRAALVEVRGVEGWDPHARDEYLGLMLWRESALDGLPRPCVTWLAEVAHRLTSPAPEKKRPLSSPPDGTTGTTGASTSGATPAGSG